MIKYLLLLITVFGLSSCTEKDAQYYRYHPKELEQVMKNCPDKAPKQVSCQQLEEIAIHLNSLGRQLQYNPQEFGGAIIKLQETIAQQKAELLKESQNKELQEDLNKNQSDLAQRMAVVRWLESPES